MSTRAVLGLTLGFALAVAAGCSEAGKSETVPVSGTVTYNNKPVADLKILLTPASGRPADGILDANGHFASVTTDKPGDGAVPGKAKVSISAKPASAPAPGANTTEAYATPKPTGLPAKYNSAQTSDVEVTINATGKNDLKIELKD